MLGGLSLSLSNMVRLDTIRRCGGADGGLGSDLKQAEASEDEDEIEGPSARLVQQLLKFLLKGFQAKNKIARFRCVQLVALMVNSLGEIE